MVIAIKSIHADLPKGTGMNFHNNADGTDFNFTGGDKTVDTNTWVPYQASKKQIKIELKDENQGFKVFKEFYLWDDNYKLMFSYPGGIQPILTVSGNVDVGIKITVTGVQAYTV